MDAGIRVVTANAHASGPVARFAHLIGIQPQTTPARIAQAFLGASVGIFLTGFVIHLGAAGGMGLPLLIAPIGASAVLLFAVPASPLAQPWAIVGGNTVSALAGIACLKLIGDPGYAACLAVASAIAAMSLARCLHPPGGAVALTTVIGGHAIAAAGWSFALVPVAADSVLLVVFGWLFNAAIRGNYPHRSAQYIAPGGAPAGFTIADVESVLAQYDELLDVSSEDLDTLFRQVEARAYRRLHGVIRCETIMRSGIASVRPADPIAQAVTILAKSGDRALLVVDADGHVEGLVSAGILATAAATGTVAEVMNPSPCVVQPGTPIDDLLPILSGGIYREAVVVDSTGNLLGIIDQTDLLATIWRGHIAEYIAGSPA